MLPLPLLSVAPLYAEADQLGSLPKYIDSLFSDIFSKYDSEAALNAPPFVPY